MIIQKLSTCKSLTCELCRSLCSSLVDSHIVPRAFYGDLRSSELIGKRIGEYDRTYRKGIYSKFLCVGCEKKFEKIDNDAVKLIKQQKSWAELHSVGDQQVFVVEDAMSNMARLHDFALSLLWRASASGRDEFSDIRLGGYQEKLRNAFHLNTGLEDLRGKTGLLFQDYRNGEPEFNRMFQPYRLFKNGKEFRSSFGNFHCHVFGFPYGELYVRLGGSSPLQGYFDCEFDKFSGKAVLWTSNLTARYPNWIFDAKPNAKAKVLYSSLYPRECDSR